MAPHQEAGHGPTLGMAEAIANGNSANVEINGNSHNGVNGNRGIYANGEDGTFEGQENGFASVSEANHSSYEPIAIIGCGMRLPGAIDTDEALWELLSGKQDGRCRVPMDRYNVDAFYGPGKAGHVCTEFG